MNVTELRRLADWYADHFLQLNSLYNGLVSPIQHNASQSNKQPVEAQLDTLLDYLRAMSFDTLSLQQLKLLTNLGVSRFIGEEGAAFVETVIRTADFDANTAAAKLVEALQVLSSANSDFEAYRSAVSSLSIGSDEAEDEDVDRITVRVGFQNQAAIRNLSEWKTSAGDWYDIIRGVSMAAGEAPEETKIIGASTGSIILILSATAATTGLLALISKNITAVAKNAIDIRIKMEELQQMKLLTAGMKKEFVLLEKQNKETALKEIIDLIKVQLPNLKAEKEGDKITALEASVKKLLAFNEKGGNVDFVAPEEEPTPEIENEQSAEKSPKAALSAARAAIHEYQASREQIRMLTDGRKKD